MMMNMLNDPNNNPRRAIHEKHLENLERWYEMEMDILDEQLMLNRVTQEEYDDMVDQLKRDYDEDYADIFAG